MKGFLRGLLIFVLFLLAAAAVMVWPVINYQNAGGELGADWKPPEDPSEELGIAAAILIGSAIVSFILVIFGISWTLLKAWKPFAITLGTAFAVNAIIILLGALGLAPEWLPAWLVITIPLGLIAVLYSIFLSLRNNLLLITFIKLTAATILSALISLLYPFIILGVALYLKNKRGMTFKEVWSESPDIYNFVIVNIYPIFFQILPGLNYVKKKAKEEERRYRKTTPPKYLSKLDLEKLKPGDIILTGSDSWRNSAPIQASNILSASEDQRYWSHSTIYAGEGQVIEAQPDGRGVTITDLTTGYFDRGFKLWVWRHRFLDDDQLEEVVKFCRNKAEIGCPYDNWGVSFYALAALIPPMMSGWLESPFAERFFNVKGSYFCSELIADAFLETGHDVFGRKPWRVKPLDFAHTPLFEEVDCNFKRWTADSIDGETTEATTSRIQT